LPGFKFFIEKSKLMTSFNVVTIYDNRRWDRYVRSAHRSDFNHTWHYHSTTVEGEPLLLVYEEDSEYIALPVIRKYGADRNDMRQCSLYSYAGPISGSDFATLGEGMQERFEAALQAYIEQHGINGVCIQLHPLIHENFKPMGLGVLKKNSDSMLINISDAPDVQPAYYGESFGNDVKLLKRKGYTVRQAVAIQDVDMFADVFHKNIYPLSTTAAHRYDKAWFRQILRPAGFDSSLLLATQGTHTAAGVLLTFCNDLMQLHLAATHENFLFDAPLRILLHEATMLGKTFGMRYLQLQGLAQRPEVLFACKAFSPETYPGFKTWQVSYTETYCNTVRAGKLLQPLSIAV
jgi:hypothetical protein